MYIVLWLVLTCYVARMASILFALCPLGAYLMTRTLAELSGWEEGYMEVQVAIVKDLMIDQHVLDKRIQLLRDPACAGPLHDAMVNRTSCLSVAGSRCYPSRNDFISPSEPCMSIYVHLYCPVGPVRPGLCGRCFNQRPQYQTQTDTLRALWKLCVHFRNRPKLHKITIEKLSFMCLWFRINPIFAVRRSAFDDPLGSLALSGIFPYISHVGCMHQQRSNHLDALSLDASGRE